MISDALKALWTFKNTLT